MMKISVWAKDATETKKIPISGGVKIHKHTRDPY